MSIVSSTSAAVVVALSAKKTYSPVSRFVNVIVPFVVPSTYDTKRTGNSFEPLAPTSTTLDTTTNVAGDGFSVNSTVTSNRCGTPSQLTISAVVVTDFFAALWTVMSARHSGFSAYPVRWNTRAVPSGKATNRSPLCGGGPSFRGDAGGVLPVAFPFAAVVGAGGGTGHMVRGKYVMTRSAEPFAGILTSCATRQCSPLRLGVRIQSLSVGLEMGTFLASSLRTGPPFHSNTSALPSGCGMHMPVHVSMSGAPTPGITNMMLSWRMSSSKNAGRKVTSNATSVPGASLPANGAMAKCGPKDDSIHW